MAFSVYLIPLFRGKIISARGMEREEDRDAGALFVGGGRGWAVNRSEAGSAISAGRLVLNYDVDKTSEDTSRELRRVSLSCFITRRRGERSVAALRVNNQRNA